MGRRLRNGLGVPGSRTSLIDFGYVPEEHRQH